MLSEKSEKFQYEPGCLSLPLEAPFAMFEDGPW